MTRPERPPSRRAMLRALALLPVSLNAGAQPVQADTRPGMPVPPPASLEQRLGRAAYVLTGVPRRFVFAPTRLFTRFQQLKAGDSRHAELLGTGASNAELRRYWAERIDPDEFRLRDAPEPGERSNAFLEFDVDRVLFRRPRAGGDIDAARRIYIVLSSPLLDHPEAMQAWDRFFGQKVIFLTGGLTDPRGRGFVPYPVPVHALPIVNHWRDALPVPYELLPTVLEQAHRLHLEPVEKP